MQWVLVWLNLHTALCPVIPCTGHSGFPRLRHVGGAGRAGILLWSLAEGQGMRLLSMSAPDQWLDTVPCAAGARGYASGSISLRHVQQLLGLTLSHAQQQDARAC